MDITKLIQLKPKEEVMLIVHGSLIPLWSKIVVAFVWLVLPFLLFPCFKCVCSGDPVSYLASLRLALRLSDFSGLA